MCSDFLCLYRVFSMRLFCGLIALLLVLISCGWFMFRLCDCTPSFCRLCLMCDCCAVLRRRFRYWFLVVYVCLCVVFVLLLFVDCAQCVSVLLCYCDCFVVDLLLFRFACVLCL